MTATAYNGAMPEAEYQSERVTIPSDPAFWKDYVTMWPSLPIIRKSKRNEFAKFNFSTLARAVKELAPVLANNGFAISQPLSGYVDGSHSITTILVHKSGSMMVSRHVFSITEHKGMSHEQAIGTAISYFRKYAVLSIVGATSDDDDVDAVNTPPQQAQRQSSRSPTRPQLARLFAIAKAAGITEAGVKERMEEAFGKSSSKELTLNEYEKLCSELENYGKT